MGKGDAPAPGSLKPDVVVGYDQRTHSALALDEAADEAARRDAVLTVVHASAQAAQATSTAHPATDPATEPMAHRAAERIAGLGAERARSRHPRLECRTRAATGPAPTVLAAYAADADLIVVGCRGHDGLAGLTTGPVTARIAARPACPAMIVRGGVHRRMGTVLAAIDIEEPAEEVLEFAFGEAQVRRTGLKAISVRESFWPPVYAGDVSGLRAASLQAAENAELALEDMLKPWQAKYPGVHVRHELADGSPGTILTAATSHADLVVAGAHRHRGGGLPVGDEHMGSTLYTLLTRTECPVVIVPRR